jgi:small subunit ribosomal protein S6
MRKYELVMVLSPEANEDEITATLERVTNFVTQHGGSVSEEERWGIRRLAYPVRRFQEGNYTLTRFELDASDAIELERTLVSSEDVLRHLVTKVEKPKAVKTKAAKAKVDGAP